MKKFFKSMSNHSISECTAQCAYYTILSFIPLLILIVTLIQYTGISKDVLITGVQNIIPESMSESAIDIVQEVYSKSITTVSVSAIFVLWSSGKGFFALCKGLHNIYETKENYNYFWIKLKSLISTLLFVILIILVLIVSVFGNTILDFMESKIHIPNSVISVFNFTKIGVYFILFLSFLLMYRFVPGHKQTLKKQIPGALVAASGWYIISFFFSVYIDMFKGFSVMYGSLTTITLSMMWVYFCMYIILIGAEINNFKYDKF